MERWYTPYYSKDNLDEIEPPENPLLAVAAASIFAVDLTTERTETPQQMPPPSFEQWLLDDVGSNVLFRIAKNRYSYPAELSASNFDTIDDIQQKALIWLWQSWQADPDFQSIDALTTSQNHKVSYLTKRAVSRARCMYAKRRAEYRDKQVDLEYDDDDFLTRPRIPLKYVLAHSGASRATDLRDHDRAVAKTDKQTDINAAVERVVQRMIADHSIAGNHRRIPIEHITRTIIEGHMYHYTDQYNQTGNFRKFCEYKGLGKNQIYKWRPIIFGYLREELNAYNPQQQLQM